MAPPCYTNTVTRAELAATLEALTYASQLPSPLADLIIFTDSLASIHLARATLRRQDTLWEHKHAPVLAAIRTYLLA
jgi:hypothetical protein